MRAGAGIAAKVFLAAVIACGLGFRDARAQESCANLQHQLQVLRGSGGAGSQWEAFAIQRMHDLGCFGGGYSQPSGCPDGYEACGNMCCGPSNYCSRYGCIARGSVECGGYYCNPGMACMSGRKCMPEDASDCGRHYCEAGHVCSRGGGCIPADKVDCGQGRYCPEQTACWTAPADVSGIRRGELKCLTYERREELERQIARERQEELERQREAAAARKRAEEERKAELRRQEQERREAARRREQERREALARKREEDARLAAEKKRQQEEARRAAQQRAEEARRQAADVANERRMLTVMNNPRETPAARQIAAIALGRDPSSVATSARPAATRIPQQPSAAERELTRIALGRVGTSGTGPKPLSRDQLHTIANNPQESSAARQIARIALGTDTTSSQFLSATATRGPATPSTQATPGRSPPYTFQPSSSGSVQVLQDGRPIATVTPHVATQQYGYRPSTVAPSGAPGPLASTGPSGSSRVVEPVAAPLNDFFTPGRGGSDRPASTQMTLPPRQESLWGTVERVARANNAMLESRPGRIVVDTLAAAGGSYAPPWARSIDHAGELATAANHIRQRDFWSLAQQGVDRGTVHAGGALGAALLPTNPALGRAVGSGATQAIISAGHYYIAPVVGDRLFEWAPGLFTPPAAAAPISIDPFTQRPVR